MSIFQKVKKNVGSLMLIIVFSKLIGMFRDVVLANCFGTSNVSDAYLIAISVPTLIFYFIGHSLSTAYIPMYNKIKSTKGESKAHDYTNIIISIAMVICTIIVIILLISPDFMVKLFAAGFDDATTNIASYYIRVSAFSLYFMTLVNVYGSYLQIYENFVVPAMVSVPRNIVIILSIIFAYYFGIEFLGWGILFAYVAEFIFLLPFVRRSGYKFKIKINIKDEEVIETFRIITPILIGVSVGQINKIIDKSLASILIIGGVSALSYASIINNAVQEVLVTGIITILFASCSELVAQGKHLEVKKKLSNTIDTMICLLIPASIGVIFLAEPIVKVILGRGNFDGNSIALTMSALRCYTIGLVFLAIRDTIVKVFYAYKNTKITTIISTTAIGINIVFNIILSQIWGINGLALATSISAIFSCVTLYYFLRKKIGDFNLVNTLVVSIKSISCSVLMGLVVIFLFRIIETFSSTVIALIISVSIGILIYFILSVLFRVPLALNWVRKITKRI
ncbi:murein biosynthesis integral membrane protein MurJ [Thomasclavelia cocleata]|jgi:putative peptidoglycan lipid II flippase|uniref:Probable lipid II flippase MurJ n=1 Tax=Thomasclavelia cocleata TaxID=69824 RepID=A0A829Z928_9FIRM|nr:murein biosynthesis integral membrane protein MurJ [Thomasclavelia cocleata]MCI9132085.1 murein biosynthesis integral membrane protein MurJ [Thomasclavelia cocleata]MCI9631464.1 murein biosynthesis integral membrane protein MurJ [Thomasclavelia cocleata]GFI40472.1 lipid II flippase MurJ [Thomasclavelia cocleata]